MSYRPIWPCWQEVSITNRNEEPIEIQQPGGSVKTLRPGQSDTKMVIFWLWWVWEIPVEQTAVQWRRPGVED